MQFPFGSLKTEELSNLFDFDVPSFVDSALSFEITSGLTNLHNLQDYDIDENLPSNIDSNYHTVQDVSSSDISDNDLSLFHMNVRSLSCHFDELHSVLVNLKIGFDVVAVTETWNSFDHPLSTNVDIEEYTFFSLKSKS